MQKQKFITCHFSKAKKYKIWMAKPCNIFQEWH